MSGVHATGYQGIQHRIASGYWNDIKALLDYLLCYNTARIADQRIAGITHKRDILSLTQQLQKTVCTLSLIVLVMGNQSGMNTEMR